MYEKLISYHNQLNQCVLHPHHPCDSCTQVYTSEQKCLRPHKDYKRQIPKLKLWLWFELCPVEMAQRQKPLYNSNNQAKYTTDNVSVSSGGLYCLLSIPAMHTENRDFDLTHVACATPWHRETWHRMITRCPRLRVAAAAETHFPTLKYCSRALRNHIVSKWDASLTRTTAKPPVAPSLGSYITSVIDVLSSLSFHEVEGQHWVTCRR